MLAYILSHQTIGLAVQTFAPRGLPANAVHGEYDLLIDRPLEIGRTVRIRAMPSGVARAPGGGLITIRVEVLDQDGTPWNAQMWTAFLPGWKPPWSRGDVPLLPSHEVSGEADVSVQVATTADQALRYNAVDHPNPIHTDEHFARALGFKGTILQGTCTIALVGGALLTACGETGSHRLRRLAARFSHPVHPGEVLSARLWRNDDKKGRFVIYNEDGKAVLQRGVLQLS
jgi:acyl dehydratase